MSQEVSATNGSLTITSTTATQEEVNTAAGLSADGKEAPPKDEPKESSEAAEKQAESAAESETAEENEEREEGEKKKNKGGFQRRIDKLTAEKYRLEGELKAERERKLDQKMDEDIKKIKEAADARIFANGEPRPEDFETTEGYIKAQAKWEVKQELAEQKAIEDKRTQEAKDREVLDNYTKRVEETRTKHEDWDEVYESLGDAQIPIEVQLALVKRKDGPELVYHLAKNAELRQQLNEMDPLEAVSELGAIAASISSQSRSEESAPKKTVSSAPAPIKPLGGANTKSQTSLDTMNMKDYIAARRSGRTA